MVRTGTLIAIAFITAMLAPGCGKGGDVNPTLPADKDSLAIQQSNGSPNRHLWGLWEISISANRDSCDIIPARSTGMHLNVVRLLEVTPCSACLKIDNLKIVEPNVLEADLTLAHPFPGLLKYTGFDVRGIFIAQTDFTFPVSGRKIAWGDSVPRMLNPDGCTSLFNPTEFPPTSPPILGYIPGKKATGGDLTATLNPFLAYLREASRRMFESGGSEARTVRLYAPPGPLHFGYAVDACWQLVPHEIVDPLTDFPPDANCLEAYKIRVDVPGHLGSTPGSQAAVYVEVFDHQGLSTISSVAMEAPDLFPGTASLSYSTQTGEESWLFSGTITNETGIGSGLYPLLAKAVDTESDQNLGEIDAWQVARACVDGGWARTWGGSDDDSGYGVAVDGSGNVYVSGFFHSTVEFDPGAGVDLHSSNGIGDIFLSKFDSSGTFEWARTWGGIYDDWANDVDVDESGNAYVTGCFVGDSVDFNPDPNAVDLHSSNGWFDAFLSKFDSSGSFVWARTWGGSDNDFGIGVALDGTGNVHVTGEFSGTSVDFNPDPNLDDPHSSNGNTDIFLSKFDSSGTFVWARTWGGSDLDRGYGIDVDGSGNVYTTGYFKGIVDFDPDLSGVDPHSSAGFLDIFLSKFDSSGNHQWARTWGGIDEDCGHDVDTDESGGVYVTGYFSGTSVDFNPDPIADDPHSSNGDCDIFLGKFDSYGTFLWARTWGGSYRDEGYSVDVDVPGNVYVTGYFQDTSVDFNPDPTSVDPHSSNGEYDIFLSKFDSSGAYVWGRTWGGNGWDYGDVVYVDGSGNVYLSGEFEGTSLDFNPDPIADDPHSSNGEWDIFLSKFKPDGYW